MKGLLSDWSKILRPARGADDKVLVFVHLPKCAGNTLLPILMSHYRRADGVMAYPEDEQDLVFSRVLNERGKCYCGHFYMDIDAVPDNFVCVSVMRDPVRRIVSHYYYVKGSPQHPQHRLLAERGYSLLDYALSDANDIELDNGQLRQLAGLRGDAAIDDKVFAAARRKISEIYALIGMTERLDDFIGDLSDLMSWKRPPRYKNRNVGGYEAPSLPEEVATMIRERNKWDQRLYGEIVSGTLAKAAVRAAQ